MYLVGCSFETIANLTERGRECLGAADTVLIDEVLVDALKGCFSETATILPLSSDFLGAREALDKITKLATTEVKNGHRVVRLCAGDPYVDGRGSELALRCAGAKIPFEVIPSAPLALEACCLAGVALIHPGLSKHATWVSAETLAHEGLGSVDFAWLAKSQGSLLMNIPVGLVEPVTQMLVKHGMKPSLPCAVIFTNTSTAPQVLSSALNTCSQLTAKLPSELALTLAIGRGVELRDHLAWKEKQPLFGLHIAYFQSTTRSTSLARQLRALGANAHPLPILEVAANIAGLLDSAVEEISKSETVIFSDEASITHLFSRLKTRGLDARSLGPVKNVIVLSADAQLALEDFGIVADLAIASAHIKPDQIVHELAKLPLFGTRCVIFEQIPSGMRLGDSLAAIGVKARSICIGRTLRANLNQDERSILTQSAVVLLTSESDVERLSLLAGGDDQRIPPCITSTSAVTTAARKAQLPVALSASAPSDSGLISAILDFHSS